MNERDEQRPKPRRTRADALRNREQILRAAADLIVEQGPGASMELIARRASVGIATLYRHFPDRTTLLRQVAMETLRQAAEEARSALAEEADAFTALARYMHDSIDLRIGAVMPALAERLTMDDELMAARQNSREAHEALITAAHSEGSLRPEVTAGDIGLLIMRFTTPLPGRISPSDNHRLSHRHLELILDGLPSFLSQDNLPGPEIPFDDIIPIGANPNPPVPEIRPEEHPRWWRR
jgi:AcrR family transcriptional regulator